MKLAIMQPYLFPYIGYFQLINAVDKFIILEDVNFINRGWINRNYILVNGKKNLFTVPLEKASQNKLIKDTHIVSDTKWKINFLKTIKFSYSMAPYFKNIYPIIQIIINNKEYNLSKFIYYSLIKITEYLNIKTKIVPSSEIYRNNHLKGQYRILDICKKEKANHYINPPGGQELYERDLFEKNGIKINFIKTNYFFYKQINNEFVPNLSILDILMFNSKDQIYQFLKEYILI
ncbi:MAG: WbqC family protein [Candidatus Helarchaeota archaeon]